MALPTARTPGFTSFQTRWGPRTTCECLAQWLPAFARRLGVSISALEITQLTGGASASAGTHSQGGAADLLSTNREWVRIAREMGAAAWVRTRAQGFDVAHIHLVLNSCPHNGPARYQVNALAAGFNGLGSGGRGGRDDGPGPQKLRTWSQGIAWAAPSSPAGGFLMSLSASEQKEVLEILRDLRPGKAGRWHDGPGFRMIRVAANAVGRMEPQVSHLHEQYRVGVPGKWHDGQAFGFFKRLGMRLSTVLPGLSGVGGQGDHWPAIHAAITNRGTGEVDVAALAELIASKLPDDIAKQFVDELSNRLEA